MGLCLIFAMIIWFQVRDPMPAVFFFLIDVSMNAVQTGATAAACSAISQSLADLPVDNGRFRLSPLATGRYQPGCALATTRKCEKKQERRRIKRENIGHCRSLIARWRLGFFFATFFVVGWRRLRPENLRTTSRMRRTSRGGDFFAVVFSSSPSQVIRKRGGLDDVAEPSPHPCREEKTRRFLFFPRIQCRQGLEQLLENIPSMFDNNKVAESAFGAAIKVILMLSIIAGFLALKPTGGKLLVFQSVLLFIFAVLPSVGIGSLSSREAEGRTNVSAGDKVYLLHILFLNP
ncbi:hypothetical protein BHE74_00011960 [Ensete ventricosum]|nr:hypothetical protein GW17_00033524 [Ensete ventricosum]RWW79737.1 hypothetical protein BHE74_00011960 [Ensete ventricosum]